MKLNTKNFLNNTLWYIIIDIIDQGLENKYSYIGP